MNIQKKRQYDQANSSTSHISAEEGIRQGLDDARNGRLQPIREFFAEFEAIHPELKEVIQSPTSPA
jgi:hypothetical protein